VPRRCRGTKNDRMEREGRCSAPRRKQSSRRPSERSWKEEPFSIRFGEVGYVAGAIKNRKGKTEEDPFTVKVKGKAKSRGGAKRSCRTRGGGNEEGGGVRS